MNIKNDHGAQPPSPRTTWLSRPPAGQDARSPVLNVMTREPGGDDASAAALAAALRERAQGPHPGSAHAAPAMSRLAQWANRQRAEPQGDERSEAGGQADRRGRDRGDRGGAGPSSLVGSRLKTQLRLRLTLGGGGAAAETVQIRELLTADLSAGGVFVECADPPPVGTRARVEVCRPSGGVAFAAQGEVAWQRSGSDRAGRMPGFGLRFERLDLRDSGVISGLMDLLQRQQLASSPLLPGVDLMPDLALYGLDDTTSDVTAILQVPLPGELQAFIEGFNRVADRDAFLWRWAYQGIHLSTLSCVEPRLIEPARQSKLLGVMYLILLDDALDRALQEERHPDGGGRPRQTVFEALCQLPTLSFSEAHSLANSPSAHPCVAFGWRLWSELHRRVQALPRASEFMPLWHLDLAQHLQDARYQRLVRARPQLTSASECMTHSGGFGGLPLQWSGSLDLCASPGFDARETGLLREVLLLAQRMHYLSYVLAGWQRHCALGDLSGPAVAHGVMTGVVSPAELQPEHGDVHGPDIAERLRLARLDSHFLTEWLRTRHQTRELAARLRSVDMQRLLHAHQRLLWLQLHHRGLL